MLKKTNKKVDKYNHVKSVLVGKLKKRKIMEKIVDQEMKKAV